MFGAERIEWFNGGLFDSGAVLPLTAAEIELVEQVSRLDWSQVEPAIFGTLFERGLDPEQAQPARRPLHRPRRDHAPRSSRSCSRPLRREFEAMQGAGRGATRRGQEGTARDAGREEPARGVRAFLDRLRAVRVLDPACGSGNFLYLALLALKDLELEAILWGSLACKMPGSSRRSARGRAWASRSTPTPPSLPA